MKEETVRQLQKIAKPRSFSQDEYVCYEGEPGNEMYIILKGSVGVYVTNAMGTLVQISEMNVGDFFGEMAIFDKLPRSASCIALEPTICVAINKHNLMDFICQCPDMAEKILENMSTRIRKLNNDLYKNTRPMAIKQVGRFEIPVEYGFSHVVKEPYQDPKYFAEDKHKCPVCGKEITVINMKRHLMKVKNVDMDCRINYLMCEPLWHEILTCPHCYYSNYSLNFFGINPADVKTIRKVLKDEHTPVIENPADKRTAFDNLVLHYLQAIHINEVINGNDNAIIGKLWLYLYWLGKDSGDNKFADYCANKAIEKLKAAIDEKQIDDATSRCSIALSLGNLLMYKQINMQAMKYVEMALECVDDTIRNCAEQFRDTISTK
ncbi:MAG: DUF2225 domain-containing protein [Lachnospiraceae bacterium]|nr:DUF2225 domain-containing protein [Lachnospiraceae bacterium]